MSCIEYYIFDLEKFLSIEKKIFEKFTPPVDKESISYEIDIIDKLYIMLLEEMEEINIEYNSDDYNKINVIKEIADCICYSGTIMQYIKYCIINSNLDNILEDIDIDTLPFKTFNENSFIYFSEKNNTLHISEDESIILNKVDQLIKSTGNFTVDIRDCKESFLIWSELINDYFRKKYIYTRMDINERKWHKCYSKPDINKMDNVQLIFYLIPYIEIYKLCQDYIVYLFNIALYHFGFSGNDLDKIIKEKQNSTLDINENDYK